jgi:hypothetical protein
MGTRADFYVGRGEQAEWLGSIAWDGHPGSIGNDGSIVLATTEADYRQQVTAFLASRDDATLPEQGWPWPWDDSHLTDYAYAFDGDALWSSRFGREWFRVRPFARDFGEPDELMPETAVFPDMAARKAVTYGPRSGVIVVSFPSGGGSR